jgi:hypothetical protein
MTKIRSKKQNTNRMESTGFNLSAPLTAALLFVVLLSLWAAYSFYMGKASVPLPSYKLGFRSGPSSGQIPSTEGFYGGVAMGAGEPDCLRTSSEGAALIDLFSDKPCTSESGADDLRELKQIASKLSCFKKDLLSPSHMIDATRYQKFTTSHDIEPVAETTGRCFAKTLSPRDLELSIEKWTGRGSALVKRLSASYRLAPPDVEKAQTLFQVMVRDVADVARSTCMPDESVATPAGPRDPAGLSEPGFEQTSEYKGYY